MATLEASREKEHRHNKFMAALKGIDIDAESKQNSMERVLEEMARIEAENGIEPSSQKKDEFTSFGIAVVEGE